MICSEESSKKYNKEHKSLSCANNGKAIVDFRFLLLLPRLCIHSRGTKEQMVVSRDTPFEVYINTQQFNHTWKS